MKSWKQIVLYIGAFFLQPFLYNLLPGSTVPNLILILTVTFTFLYDDENEILGITLGIIFALINDMCYGLHTGPAAVALIGTVLMVVLFKHFTNKENIVNIIVTMLLSSWIYSSIYWLIYFAIGSAYSYVYAMRTLPWQLGYNVVVAVILYLILIKSVIKHRRDRYFR